MVLISLYKPRGNSPTAEGVGAASAMDYTFFAPLLLLNPPRPPPLSLGG